MRKMPDTWIRVSVSCNLFNKKVSYIDCTLDKVHKFVSKKIKSVDPGDNKVTISIREAMAGGLNGKSKTIALYTKMNADQVFNLITK